MNLSIDIDDRYLSNVSMSARECLTAYTEEYVVGILQEASGLEEGERQSGANSEITSNHIVQAVDIKKMRRHEKKKRTIGEKILRIVSIIFTACMGFLYDRKGFAENPIMLFFFLGVFLIAVVTTTISEIKER